MTCAARSLARQYGKADYPYQRVSYNQGPEVCWALGPVHAVRQAAYRDVALDLGERDHV